MHDLRLVYGFLSPFFRYYVRAGEVKAAAMVWTEVLELEAENKRHLGEQGSLHKEHQGLRLFLRKAEYPSGNTWERAEIGTGNCSCLAVRRFLPMVGFRPGGTFQLLCRAAESHHEVRDVK